MEHDLTFSQGQWETVLWALVATFFVMVAGFAHSLVTRDELGVKYRPVATTSSIVQLVALLSYVSLIVSWLVGYKMRGGLHVPNPAHEYDNGYRYMDWTVSVPLLTVELVAVSTLVGQAARRTRTLLVTTSALMVVTGFLGESVFGDRGRNTGALLLWGVISTVFFVPAYVVVLRVCRDSARALPPEIAVHMRSIGWVFALTWGVYPLAWLPMLLDHDSASWGVARQVSMSLATMAAKGGFGVLAHQVAKMRTAHDLETGEQTHDEDVWVSGVELASARPALADWLTARAAPAARGRAPG